uniref:Uncharacterized protein n=1 Tax=Panagrolaimus sp. JU765 TaxID=591449 RepID=A0AC34RG95_9BILA
MFCFVKSHDVLCGFLEKDKFVINMTYNHCAFLGEGGRVAHLVIGQRTENKQAFFFETVVKEGEPRNIRK